MTKRFTIAGRDFPIDKACDPSVEEAVRAFEGIWRRLEVRPSNRVRAAQVSHALIYLVLPRWLAYAKSLPKPLRRKCLSSPVRRLCMDNSFETADLKLGEILYSNESDPALSDFGAWEFGATISALREVVQACQNAKGFPPGELVLRLHQRAPTACAFKDASGIECQNLTEYYFYLRGFLVSTAHSPCRQLSRNLCILHSGFSPPAIGRMPSRDTTVIRHLTPTPPPPGLLAALCRYCGRLTESAARFHADVTNVGNSVLHRGLNLSNMFCAEHKPPRPGKTNDAYTRALRHEERYDDLRARLCEQCYSQMPERLHFFPEVNWFENEVVRRIDARCAHDRDPREAAESEVFDMIKEQNESLWMKYADEIDQVVKTELVDRISGRSDLFGTTRLGDAMWKALRGKHVADPPLFERVYVLLLIASGMHRSEVSSLLQISRSRVRMHIDRVLPVVQIDESVVNLRRVARDLEDRGVTDQKKRIVYYLAMRKSRSEIASLLGVSPVYIWKLIQSIPRAYRFDEEPRHWYKFDERPASWREYHRHIEALQLPFGLPWRQSDEPNPASEIVTGSWLIPPLSNAMRWSGPPH